MKRSVMGRVGAALLAFSMITGGMGASAMAQSDQEPRKRWYDMEGLEIEGETKGSSVVKVKGKKSAVFRKLGRIERHSMLPKLKETSQERALSGAN